MIKQFGRLFCAYPVQSVHEPLNLLIRFQLVVRGHHDWPDKSYALYRECAGQVELEYGMKFFVKLT